MAKVRFHRVAAIAVLIATAAWVATGEFSSVGSAANEDEAAPATETAEQEDVSVVRTVTVVDAPRVEHARAIRLAGNTDADKRATLATRAAGIIEELDVRLGSAVEKGDLIIKLENEGKDAAVETARQLLAQREAEVAAAERLAASGNLPKLQLDNARSGLAQARSQLEAALADLGRNEMRAPFAGVIDTLSVELGSSVAQGAQVATILNLDPILAIGEVNERDLAHVKPGNAAEIVLVNGRTVEGEVRYVSRDATAATRTYRVEVAIPNPDRDIPAGMTAEITLKAEPVRSAVLPRSVVTLSQSGDLGIRAVDSDNKVVFFPIDLVDDTTEGLVLGGIPDDVRIIIAGQEMITEGDTVDPVVADSEQVQELAERAAAGTN